MIVLQVHIVPEGISNIRLSDYAVNLFDKIPTKKGVKKAIKRGEVHVNDLVGKTGTWIQTGQTIKLIDKEERLPKKLELSLEVVYEDNYMAIINKPAGIVVSGNRYRTIENALSFNLQKSQLLDALKWPRPVHRLDNQTSGLLMVAKTYAAHISLSKQLEDKIIKKKYRAIVTGKTSEKGTINETIDGKKAITHYHCLKQVPSLQNKFLSLLELDLETGRTHQLRKHLSSIGHPIVGDKLYGIEGAILKHKGLFLAAIELEFLHPETQEIKQMQIPTPNKFKSLLDRETRRFMSFSNKKNQN